MPSLELAALGTRWWITADDALDATTVDTITSEITRFERSYSRFSPDSQLSRLNTDKILARPSQEIRNILAYALQIHQDSEGVFNISIASDLEHAGYGMRPDIQSRVSNDLLSDVRITPEAIVIEPWVRLDFGGFGKGWLIDTVGKMLSSTVGHRYIVNGGGDLLGGPNAGIILIEHPLDSTLAIGSVDLSGCAIASSSRQKRQWQKYDGTTETHIRPTTNHATDDILSIHVKAHTALLADTYATIFLLVDHHTRLRMAASFGLEFMEIRSDLTYWQTANFGFVSNS